MENISLITSGAAVIVYSVGILVRVKTRHQVVGNNLIWLVMVLAVTGMVMACIA